MKILWLTWKDETHPLAGGAEVVASELSKRLVQSGHELIFVVGGYEGARQEEQMDGYRVIRVGGRWSVYWHAYRYYKKNLIGWADVVIDEMNTIPFFAKYYVKEKNIMFVHQLCREIWFYQMFFPLNIIGYILEFCYLRLLNDREVITVSKSTKKDLMRYGFKKEKIHIISEGSQLEPIRELDSCTVKSQKFDQLTILSLGSVRAMKRTNHIVKAFEILKSQHHVIPAKAGIQGDKVQNAKLVIAGDTDDPYAKKVLIHIKNSPVKDDITVLGRVSTEKKIQLMQKSHLIAVTSIKEGWGLIVTEAASQGTPAVVYDVDGLRDAAEYGHAGYVTEENTPESLAESMAQALMDDEVYSAMRERAWKKSKEITFEKSCEDLYGVISGGVERSNKL